MKEKIKQLLGDACVATQQNLNYNKKILLDIISKLYNTHGSNMIKAITKGSNIVQQKDIS